MTSKPQSHATVVIRSLQWPGAFTFYNASRGLISIYVGEGHKFDAIQTFYQTKPPVMQLDPSEYLTIMEPNPSDEFLKAA